MALRASDASAITRVERNRTPQPNRQLERLRRLLGVEALHRRRVLEGLQRVANGVGRDGRRAAVDHHPQRTFSYWLRRQSSFRRSKGYESRSSDQTRRDEHAFRRRRDGGRDRRVVS